MTKLNIEEMVNDSMGARKAAILSKPQDMKVTCNELTPELCNEAIVRALVPLYNEMIGCLLSSKYITYLNSDDDITVEQELELQNISLNEFKIKTYDILMSKLIESKGRLDVYGLTDMYGRVKEGLTEATTIKEDK